MLAIRSRVAGTPRERPRGLVVQRRASGSSWRRPGLSGRTLGRVGAWPRGRRESRGGGLNTKARRHEEPEKSRPERARPEERRAREARSPLLSSPRDFSGSSCLRAFVFNPPPLPRPSRASRLGRDASFSPGRVVPPLAPRTPRKGGARRAGRGSHLPSSRGLRAGGCGRCRRWISQPRTGPGG
jgi:hypothetical protein